MLRQYEAEDLAPLAEQLRQENQRAKWITVGILLAFLGIPLTCISLLFDIGSEMIIAPFVAATIILANALRRSKQRRRAFITAFLALSHRASRTEIEAILRMRTASFDSRAPEEGKLQAICDSLLRCYLPRATEDEIQRLSPEARRCLASLLRPSLGSIWTQLIFAHNQEPNMSQAELATAILLALASLKQPGGERSARRILKHFKNESLREAAQEYLNSLRP
ncbi:hypothetical protein [Armatimonas sp.]|uniref:hypothetical protein n=1 Tax=Armatimonas sp. TaxID=1872638 RepID=UPI00374DD500